ncbi:MAG: hypothetical protein MJE68_06695, partial [Proteobacteria bacterium]|nr:hypothetical protein [Pseudomonadota bacterium]
PLSCVLHVSSFISSPVKLVENKVQMFLLRIFFELYRDCQSLHAMRRRLTVSSLFSSQHFLERGGWLVSSDDQDRKLSNAAVALHFNFPLFENLDP